VKKKVKSKIGENIIPVLCLSICVYIVYSVFKNNRTPNLPVGSHADKTQYANRLIEFFDSESIELAYKKYQEYVDFGISAQDAFLILTEDKTK